MRFCYRYNILVSEFVTEWNECVLASSILAVLGSNKNGIYHSLIKGLLLSTDNYGWCKVSVLRLGTEGRY